MHEITPEKNLIKVVEDLDTLKKIEPQGWVIRYQGHTLTLHSGKAIWKRENHAKAALANHFTDFYSWKQLEDWGFKNGTEVAQYLVKEGILKVERL